MVKVLIKSDSRFPIDRKIIRRAIAETLSSNRGTDNVEISVAVVGQRKMNELSYKFLKDRQKHEVLSFPLEDFRIMPDKVVRLGDIVLCWPQVLLAARRDGVMVDDEVYQLTSHSVEHLLGKHHE